jgi:site-specific DNA recombinase
MKPVIVAGIYARKSSDQTSVADDAKSVTRQIETARAFAARKGWPIDEAHIFIDDGISGAVFSGRPGFMRLLNAMKPRPTIQVLILSELSRLGREQLETGYAVKQLSQAGVRIFSYLEDKEIQLDTPTDKFLMSAVNFASEVEREKARQRTYDAMARKAQAGHVTGGKCFGYDNVRLNSHVERRINEAEAVVVRHIFDLSARGSGARTIAKQLNDEHAPSPRSQQGRPQSWAPSSVRAVLFRELYRGEILWNQTHKRDSWGHVHQQARPEDQWVRVCAPELRIVSEELWRAAHQRIASASAVYLRGTDGRLWGRPATGIESKYLLPGIAKCAICGGGLLALSRSHGRKRVHFYACSSYHQRGTSVCANGVHDPMVKLDAAVVTAFERQLLGPGMVDEIIEAAVRKLPLAVKDVEQDRAATAAAVARIEAEIVNLTAAVAAGGELAALVTGIKDREAERNRLLHQMATSDRAEKQTQATPARLREQLEERFADWRGILHRQSPMARQIVKKLLVGPLKFTPKQDADGTTYYEFEGEGSLAKLLGDLVPIMVASPTGFEPVF